MAELLVISSFLMKSIKWASGRTISREFLIPRPEGQHILVTGSARLQEMGRTGDSLAGRFFSHTLLPFSLDELRNSESSFELIELHRRGGFPEPLLIAENEDEVERWRQQYLFALLREDIPDFKGIQNYKKMESLLYLLQERVGSPLSVQSLCQALKLDHETISRYLSILEDLFIYFSNFSLFKKYFSLLVQNPRRPIFTIQLLLIRGEEYSWKT